MLAPLGVTYIRMAEAISFSGKQVDTVNLSVNLRAFVRKETKRRWVAVCPAIDVASQGDSQEIAKASLREAVEGWFESCIERGVLDEALRESNFRPLAVGGPLAVGEEPRPDEELVELVRVEEAEPDVRGDAFPITVTIPAYQAAALLACDA